MNRVMNRVNGVICLLITLFMVSPLSALTKEQRDQLNPSIVSIMTPDGMGTGFYLAPNLIATAYHVVEDARYGVAFIGTLGDQVELARVIAFDKEADVALLETVLVGKGIPIALDILPRDSIYTIGHGDGNYYGLDEGEILGVTHIKNEALDGRYVRHNMYNQPGDSGSPVFNSKGEVIGIVSMVSYYAPINHILPLLEELYGQGQERSLQGNQ